MKSLFILACIVALQGSELLAARALPATLPIGQADEVKVDSGLLIAQAKRRSRKKILTGEARTSASKTEIDFEAASIDGERRAPVGVAIGSNKQDHGYDLINLRLRWHPEMVKSTSNLETGKGR